MTKKEEKCWNEERAGFLITWGRKKIERRLGSYHKRADVSLRYWRDFQEAGNERSD